MYLKIYNLVWYVEVRVKCSYFNYYIYELFLRIENVIVFSFYFRLINLNIQ